MGKMKMTPKPGDYVLATKYSDGDSQEYWAVGFYAGASADGDRHYVVDHRGEMFRASGFGRVKKISQKRGDWILDHARIIEQSSHSMWHYARCKMDVVSGM